MPHMAALWPLMHYAQSRDYRCPHFFAKLSPHPPHALCVESGLSLLRVGIIVAQSRDYRCPHFFCEALTSACYKDFRGSYRIMHT
jgi:hypothetical protein